MTTTRSEPVHSRPSGFWARLPKGVRLDEAGFRSRHRIISGVLVIGLLWFFVRKAANVFLILLPLAVLLTALGRAVVKMWVNRQSTGLM